ncbi:MAG TPA: histidinol-phosphate transaminase [Firmicutes bacterium]|nr:histidinol-phosphate transaminase [Bacillota bacterium]
MLDPLKFAKKGLIGLPPYVPGKPIEEVKRELGLEHVTKLASNENPLGPSPMAVKAMGEELLNQNQYPEPGAPELKAKLASKLGITPEMLFLSNGGDNVISCAMHSMINPGEKVILADISFPTYERAAAIAGAVVVKVPLRNFRYDLSAMRREVDQNTKMVVVCNPNNPTGLLTDADEMRAFRESLPEEVVLFVDEAYYEFVEAPDRYDTIDAIKNGLPVIALRTFSKLYGLAGLRLGYAIAPKELISVMEIVREPFSASRIAQAAAIAALEDGEFVRQSLRLVREGRRYLEAEFRRLKLDYLPTQSNFFWVRTGVDSRELFQQLLRMGVIIRPGYLWGCPEYIRVTIGTQPQNEHFISALEKVLSR